MVFSGGFDEMSGPELLVLGFLMVVGRLEIYTVLLLLSPGFWRRARRGTLE